MVLQRNGKRPRLEEQRGEVRLVQRLKLRELRMEVVILSIVQLQQVVQSPQAEVLQVLETTAQSYLSAVVCFPPFVGILLSS